MKHTDNEHGADTKHGADAKHGADDGNRITNKISYVMKEGGETELIDYLSSR